MAIQYIKNSTANNPHVASFSLGVKILGEAIQSISIQADPDEFKLLEGDQNTKDPLFQLFPLATYLFLNFRPSSGVLITSNIELVADDGAQNGDVLTVGLMELLSDPWKEGTLSAAAKHIAAFAGDNQLLFPDHIIKQCKTLPPFAITDRWDQFFLELWEMHAMPYIKSHGGYMALEKLEMTPQADGSYKANIYISTAGACNGCGSAEDTVKKVHALLSDALNQYNTDNRDHPDFTAIHMGFIDVTQTEHKSRIVLKRPALTQS